LDGLDYRFVIRNLHHSGNVSRLFAREDIHRIRGQEHSIACMAELLTGRHLSVFRFEGIESLPADMALPNWDCLLSAIPSEQLLWNRVNSLGFSVGLMQVLGIVLAPELEGFCVTKNPEVLGLDLLHRAGLCHFPEAVADCYSNLLEEFPLIVTHPAIKPAREVLTKPAEQYQPDEVRELMRRCRLHLQIDQADAYLANLFAITADLRRRFGGDMLFLHVGHFDHLLHWFFDFHDEEVPVMFLLDRVLAYLEDMVGFDELLVFSDHGMKPSAPHLVGDGKFMHRTWHDAQSAVLMARGPGLQRCLREHPPRDLTDIYRTAIRVMERD